MIEHPYRRKTKEEGTNNPPQANVEGKGDRGRTQIITKK